MKRGGSVSGAVSLVMIFCVMCLSVFAALTLSTAAREKKLSDLGAEQAAAYYEADLTASEILTRLKNGEDPDTVAQGLEDFTFSGGEAAFSLPSGGEQRLFVSARVENGRCEILRWSSVFSGDWQPDETITVWSGD